MSETAPTTVKSIAIFAATRKGCVLGQKLAARLGGTLFAPERFGVGSPVSSFGEAVPKLFHQYDGHVFIAATGIVVRLIGPLVTSKDRDPAVVVMDSLGSFAVSLLSGHLGGANELTRLCAAISGGQPVITTATDVEGVPSMDMVAMEKGLVIADLRMIQAINGALLENRTVQLFDPDNRLGLNGDERFGALVDYDDLGEGPAVLVSNCTAHDGPGRLRLIPRDIVLGVGCRRGVPAADIIALIEHELSEAAIDIRSVVAMASIEAKQDEPGLLEAARALDADLVFYGEQELARAPVVSPPSAAQKHFGIPSVAEAAAILASHGGELLVPKRKSTTATVAVARRIHAESDRPRSG